MIRVRPTTVEWVQLNYTVDKAVEQADHVWQVFVDETLVFIAGMSRENLLSLPEFWIVVTEGLEKKWWRTLRARVELVGLIRQQFPRAVAHAQGRANERFAEFFGFRRCGAQLDADGNEWARFEI